MSTPATQKKVKQSEDALNRLEDDFAIAFQSLTAPKQTLTYEGIVVQYNAFGSTNQITTC